MHKRSSTDFEAVDWTDLTPTSVGATAGDNHIKVNVTSFSQFSGSSSTSDFVSALPVELTFFKGTLTAEKTTQLTWQTATEINNQGFEIQRSTNSEEWESIGYKSGNGTSTQLQNYEFMDFYPLAGISYYRLKQMDFDGKFAYSNIESVTMEELEDKSIKLSPNPVTNNQLTIQQTTGHELGQVTIYNLLGQPLQQLQLNTRIATIDIRALPAGQYILQIRSSEGLGNKTISKRFVKQ